MNRIKPGAKPDVDAVDLFSSSSLIYPYRVKDRFPLIEYRNKLLMNID